jgi:hypothetical protein
MKAQQKQALSQLLPTTANQAGMRMTGAGPGVSASVPQAPSLSGFTPEQIAILRTLPADQALGAITSQAFKDPKDPKAPPVSGGMQYDFNTGSWAPIPGYTEQAAAIAAAGRAPVQPPQLPADVVAWQIDKKNDPNNPAFKTIAGWRKYQQANSDVTPKILMLHGPQGEAKSVYENDPAIPGLLQSGWTTEAPAAKAGPVITGEEAAKVNLDPTRKWQQNANGSYDEIVPKAIQPSYITLVGPDGTQTTMDKSDPNVSNLLKEGYIERSGADPNSKPFTEDQSKTAQLLNEVLPDAQIAAENFDALTNLKDQFAGMTPDKVQSFFTAEPYQRAANALSHVIANNLYSLSGAAITDVEANRRARLLLPAPGDGPNTIADKKARIGALLGGMKIRAGKAGANLQMPNLGSHASPNVPPPPPGFEIVQ